MLVLHLVKVSLAFSDQLTQLCFLNLQGAIWTMKFSPCGKLLVRLMHAHGEEKAYGWFWGQGWCADHVTMADAEGDGVVLKARECVFPSFGALGC